MDENIKFKATFTRDGTKGYLAIRSFKFCSGPVNMNVPVLFIETGCRGGVWRAVWDILRADGDGSDLFKNESQEMKNYLTALWGNVLEQFCIEAYKNGGGRRDFDCPGSVEGLVSAFALPKAKKERKPALYQFPHRAHGPNRGNLRSPYSHLC